MRAYYNEIDPFCCEWLRNLISTGLIMEGDVDDRSIKDVQAKDLRGYSRVHLFAGVGGWDYALQLAGWSGERPVWTGSCPCQPFSCAGKRGGSKDERHLWPEFYRLIGECRPECVFGEQVASGDGPRWLDGVSLDLEELGYAVGSCDLPAACVGAPHIRQRLYWVAHAGSPAGERGAGGLSETQAGIRGAGSQHGNLPDGLADGSQADRLADPDERQRGQERTEDGGRQGGNAKGTGRDAEDSGLVLPDGPGPQPGREPAEADRYGSAAEPTGSGIDGVGNAGRERLEGCGIDARAGFEGPVEAPASMWSNSILIPCRDGKVRRISSQSGDEPLAYGFPRSLRPLRTTLAGMGYSPAQVRRILRRPRNLLAMAARSRIGRLKGYGNAIAPELAAKFVRAVMELT